MRGQLGLRDLTGVEGGMDLLRGTGQVQGGTPEVLCASSLEFSICLAAGWSGDYKEGM